MRKYILSIFVFLDFFMFTGCGGGSDNISNGNYAISTAAVEATLNAMEITDDSFNVNIDLTKKVDSSYQIELSNFNLSTDSCTLSQAPVFTPNVVNMNGDLNSFSTLNITGTFTQNCATTGYTLSATQTATKDGTVDTRMFSARYIQNDSTGNDNSTGVVTLVPSTGFFNATTPLDITEVNSPYKIKVQMVEDGYVVVGKIVKVKAFDAMYGTISNPETTTGTDGYAVFNYTSPNRLPANGTSTTLELTHDDNGTIITQSIVLNFVPVVDDIVTQMFLSPESFTITAPNEEQDIKIVTVNAQNIGISTNIQLEQPNNGIDYGQFDTTNVTTDANGYAVVKYTGPVDLTGLDERNISVTELNQNIEKKLNIKFNTVSQVTQYEIVATVPGSYAIDSIDQLGIKIVQIGNPDNVIPDNNVHEVNLTSQFQNMLLFSNGTDKISYNGLGENNYIGIKSLTLSGVAMINVSASIFDGKNDVVITQTLPVTIISGPVAAITIPYVSSSTCSTNSALASNIHVVHAVDKYNNPAQVHITPTLINEAKVIVPNPNYGNGTGTINNVTEFEDITANIFNGISMADRLIITPNENRHDYSYLGNWTINDVLSDNKLALVEPYSGIPVDGLSYIIGDEDRLLGRDIVVAHVVDPTGVYQTNEGGMLELEVCFDPKLAGHTFTLGAYALDNNRIGIASIESFRWGAYTSEVATVDNNSSTYTIYLGLGIGGSISEPLVDVDIFSSSIDVDKKPHCMIDYGESDFHTDDRGNIKIVLNTDGNVSETGGIDTCTLEWDAKVSSIKKEY